MTDLRELPGRAHRAATRMRAFVVVARDRIGGASVARATALARAHALSSLVDLVTILRAALADEAWLARPGAPDVGVAESLVILLARELPLVGEGLRGLDDLELIAAHVEVFARHLQARAGEAESGARMVASLSAAREARAEGGGR